MDFHNKGTLPFTIFVMAMIGAAFGIQVGKAAVIAWAAACIPAGFVYWAILSLGLAPGKGGILLPFLAAWSPNLLFAALGCLHHPQTLRLSLSSTQDWTYGRHLKEVHGKKVH